MPPRRQPTPLLALCVSAVAKRIMSQSDRLRGNWNFSGGAMPANLQIARREYISSLPATVRTLLLQEVDRLLSVDRPERSCVMSNYATAMLLGPGVQRLCVQLCCSESCCHQDAMFALIGREGAGLEYLTLFLPAFKELEPALLQRALTGPQSLKHLRLPKVCRDAYLSIISSTCPNLSLLDVSESKWVTDNGIKDLFLRNEVPFKEDIPGPGDAPLCLDSSCKRNDCKLVCLLIKLFFDVQYSGEGSREGATLRHILHCWKQETELCGSLSVLDVGQTGVTSRGALVALMKAPLLRSFGSCMKLAGAVHLLDSAWRDVYQNSAIDHPTFGLNSVHTLHITEPQLVLVSKYFPKLGFLSIHSPAFDPPALKLLPHKLNILTIGFSGFDGLWDTEIYSLGNKPQGRNLQCLSLHSSIEEDIELNLYGLFKSFPNLRTFRAIDMHIRWAQGAGDSNVLMPHLRYLNVGQQVNRKVVVKVLRRCPKLEVAHFDQCPDLTDRDIEKATYPLSEHLKCFYVYRAPRLTANTVSVMKTAYKNLSGIGDVTQWGISQNDIFKMSREILQNNWDLELTDVSHWLDEFCKRTTYNFLSADY